MFANSDDVERPQNEKTEKSGCSLRNFLIFSAALAVFAIVLVILAAGTSSNISTSTTVSTAENVDDLRNSSTQFTQNSSPGPDIFIFEYRWKVYALNPSDSELKSSFLFRTEPPSTWLNATNSSVFNAQLSKDKKKLYFFDRDNLVFDFDTREIRTVSSYLFPKNIGSDLMFKRPSLDSVLYGYRDKYKNDNFNFGKIRHYSLKELTLIKDYSTNCVNPSAPFIVGQSLDGSKLLYHCFGDHHYFLKDLDEHKFNDRLIFTLKYREFHKQYVHESFFSPDSTKLIFTEMESDYWTLINLNSENPIEESRQIYFSVNPAEFKHISLSDDTEILFFVIKDETGCRLYEINYKSLFDNDYSGPDRALNIGLGRSIELGPENEH